MYLECPVTFQENTCILIFCMYFTRIPNESMKIRDTFWDTYQIHQDICVLHVGYMRDTCGIHMRYMYLQRFEDTLRIHAGYMRDT